MQPPNTHPSLNQPGIKSDLELASTSSFSGGFSQWEKRGRGRGAGPLRRWARNVAAATATQTITDMGTRFAQSTTAARGREGVRTGRRASERASKARGGHEVSPPPFFDGRTRTRVRAGGRAPLLRLNDDQANRPQERMSAALAAAVAVVMTYTWMLVVVVVATRSMEKYPIGFPECPSDPMLQCGQETRFEAGLIRALRMRRRTGSTASTTLTLSRALPLSRWYLSSSSLPPPEAVAPIPRPSGTKYPFTNQRKTVTCEEGRERVKVGHVDADLNAMAAIREACRTFGSGQGRAFAAR